MKTVKNKNIPFSSCTNEGQGNKTKIFKYVAFGLLEVFLVLSAGYFLYDIECRNIPVFEGQKDQSLTKEKTAPRISCKFVPFALLAFFFILSIYATFWSCTTRGILRIFKGPKNTLQTSKETSHSIKYVVMTFGLFTLLSFLLFYSTFMVNERNYSARLEMVKEKKIPNQGNDKITYMISFSFVTIGLASVLLFLFRGLISLLRTKRACLEIFATKENPHQIQTIIPSLMKFKFETFQLLTVLTSLSYFSLLIYCEMRGRSDKLETNKDLRGTEYKSPSDNTFGFKLFGILATISFLLSVLIFMYCKMKWCFYYYKEKDSHFQTEVKAFSYRHFKIVVLDIFLVFLSLLCFSIYLYFGVLGFWDIFAQKDNIHETGDKILPLINFKYVVLARLALLPVLKICLIFIVLEVKDIFFVFQGNENRDQSERINTYFIINKKVAYKVLFCFFLMSLFSIATYYEFQGNFEILGELENLTQIEEKEYLAMDFYTCFSVLIAISISLNIVWVFLICMEREDFKLFEIHSNSRHADKQTQGISWLGMVAIWLLAVVFLLAIVSKVMGLEGNPKYFPRM